MKAGYGKTVRPVCAADGGKLFIGRLLRPDSWEADEQSGAIRSGVGGAKGGDQGECGPAKHVPDLEPARVSQALERIRHAVAVTHPRWEPHAGKPHVRICAGGARQLASLPLKRREFMSAHDAVDGSSTGT